MHKTNTTHAHNTQHEHAHCAFYKKPLHTRSQQATNHVWREWTRTTFWREWARTTCVFRCLQNLVWRFASRTLKLFSFVDPFKTFLSESDAVIVHHFFVNFICRFSDFRFKPLNLLQFHLQFLQFSFRKLFLFSFIVMIANYANMASTWPSKNVNKTMLILICYADKYWTPIGKSMLLVGRNQGSEVDTLKTI